MRGPLDRAVLVGLQALLKWTHVTRLSIGVLVSQEVTALVHNCLLVEKRLGQVFELCFGPALFLFKYLILHFERQLNVRKLFALLLRDLLEPREFSIEGAQSQVGVLWTFRQLRSIRT